MESQKSHWGGIPGLFRWIAAHRARQSAIRQLCRMPGWRLRDMGIDRGRIPEIVDGLMSRERALAADNLRMSGSGLATGSLDEVAVSEAPV